jgi:urocanate hydratase
VRRGAVKAPVVIGRDHLDAGSSPRRIARPEAMRDGSDAIADWPILNALVNVAAGATGVSATTAAASGSATRSTQGWSSVADGSDAQAERLERVLTTDPGTA